MEYSKYNKFRQRD